jgi:hypothetical protein
MMRGGSFVARSELGNFTQRFQACKLLIFFGFWSWCADSNRRPAHYEWRTNQAGIVYNSYIFIAFKNLAKKYLFAIFIRYMGDLLHSSGSFVAQV